MIFLRMGDPINFPFLIPSFLASGKLALKTGVKGWNSGFEPQRENLNRFPVCGKPFEIEYVSTRI